MVSNFKFDQDNYSFDTYCMVWGPNVFSHQDFKLLVLVVCCQDGHVLSGSLYGHALSRAQLARRVTV